MSGHFTTKCSFAFYHRPRRLRWESVPICYDHAHQTKQLPARPSSAHARRSQAVQTGSWHDHKSYNLASIHVVAALYSRHIFKTYSSLHQRTYKLEYIGRHWARNEMAPLSDSCMTPNHHCPPRFKRFRQQRLLYKLSFQN